MAAFKFVILSLLIVQNNAEVVPAGPGGIDAGPSAIGEGSQEVSAHDAKPTYSQAGHQAEEASESDEETNGQGGVTHGQTGEADGVEAGPVVEAGDPWSSEDVGALFITLLVLFILLGVGVSFGAYVCWKKKDSKMQEDKVPAVAIGSKEPADIGDDVSTQAGSAPVSQANSRRSSEDHGYEASADMQAAAARV